MFVESILPRIAFFIHTEEMFNHYQSVWKFLGDDSFDIILHGDECVKECCRLKSKEYGVKCFDSDYLLSEGVKYNILISNHSCYSFNGKSLIKQLGVIQVRFMYALGKHKHNFEFWNRDYNLVLCFGPWQAEKISELFRDVKTFQMGYPRYDSYFNHPELIGYQPPDLGLCPTKKTVLWLPTWLELSSIPFFSDVMSRLTEKFNVIVKTHPLSSTSEPEKLKTLESYNFTAVITGVYDNLTLFRCADFVVCDYGGTAFGALYLDKPLILLNIDGAECDSLVGEGSPDILLRDDILNYDVDNRWMLVDDIESGLILNDQVKIRRELRRKYFNCSYGFSSELAALAIKNVKHILRLG